jgi:hypothetical protein
MAAAHSPEALEKARKKRQIYLNSERSIPFREKMRAWQLSKTPEQVAEISAKTGATLRKMGWKPPVQGGNGKPMPEAQKQLLAVLGDEWVPELAVPTRMARNSGFPSCYKLDAGNPDLMIGIEADGYSHKVKVRKAQDHKKDGFLTALGWTVLRFSNQEILDWISTGMPREHLVSTILLSKGIRPLAWRESSSTTVTS